MEIKNLDKTPLTNPKLSDEDFAKSLPRSKVVSTGLADTYSRSALTNLGTQEDTLSKIEEAQNVSSLGERTKAANQGFWDILGNMSMQTLATVGGGTLEAVGAIPEILKAAVGADTDFQNIVTDWGKSIQQGTREEFPVYRENPNKAFDFSDPLAYVASNVPSLASSLTFLIPTKAASFGGIKLAKMVLGAERIANMSKEAKFLTQTTAEALLMRNLENFQISGEVYNDTKDYVLGLPDEQYNKFINDLDKDLKEELGGKSKEEVADYVSKAAGWKAYKYNLPNFAFDFLQMYGLNKAMKGVTSPKLYTKPMSVIEKHYESLGQVLSKGEKNLIRAKKFGAFVGVQGSEGIEEMVNAVGQGEGMNFGKHIINNSSKEGYEGVDLGRYLSDPQVWEQGMWGFLGGLTTAGADIGAKKLINKFKKENSNPSDEQVSEIQSRNLTTSLITKYTDSLNKDINPYTSEPITGTDEEKQDTKKEILDDLLKQAASNLTLRAAEQGNVGLLKNWLTDSNVHQMIVEQSKGILNNDDVTNNFKEISKHVDNYETVYNKFYNNIRFNKLGEYAPHIKNIILSEAINSQIAAEKADKYSKIYDSKANDLINDNVFINTLNSEDKSKTLQAIDNFAKYLAVKEFENFTFDDLYSKSYKNKSITELIDKSKNKQVEDLLNSIDDKFKKDGEINREYFETKINNLISKGVNVDILSNKVGKILADLQKEVYNYKTNETINNPKQAAKTVKDIEDTSKKIYDDIVTKTKASINQINEDTPDFENTLNQMEKDFYAKNSAFPTNEKDFPFKQRIETLNKKASIKANKESKVEPIVTSNKLQDKIDDIERRRQEELKGEDYRVAVSEEIFEGDDIDNEGEKIRLKIVTNKDGSRTLLIGSKGNLFGEGQGVSWKVIEKIGKDNTLTNSEYINVAWKGVGENFNTEGSNNVNKTLKSVEAINAKYNKELEDLNKEEITKENTRTLEVLEWKDSLIDEDEETLNNIVNQDINDIEEINRDDFQYIQQEAKKVLDNRQNNSYDSIVINDEAKISNTGGDNSFNIFLGNGINATTIRKDNGDLEVQDNTNAIGAILNNLKEGDTVEVGYATKEDFPNAEEWKKYNQDKTEEAIGIRVKFLGGEVANIGFINSTNYLEKELNLVTSLNDYSNEADLKQIYENLHLVVNRQDQEAWSTLKKNQLVIDTIDLKADKEELRNQLQHLYNILYFGQEKITDFNYDSVKQSLHNWYLKINRDLTNSNKIKEQLKVTPIINTTVAYSTSGTILRSVDSNGNTKLRSINDSFSDNEEIFITSKFDKTVLKGSNGKVHTANKEYREKAFVLIKTKGEPIPQELIVNSLKSKKDSTIDTKTTELVTSKIKDLLGLLKSGTGINSSTFKSYKGELGEIVIVNDRNDELKTFLKFYDNGTYGPNAKLSDKGMMVNLYLDGNGELVAYANNTKVVKEDIEEIISSLNRSFNYERILENKNYTSPTTGISYNSYVDFLIKEDILLTDVGKLVTKSGQKISNMAIKDDTGRNSRPLIININSTSKASETKTTETKVDETPITTVPDLLEEFSKTKYSQLYKKALKLKINFHDTLLKIGETIPNSDKVVNENTRGAFSPINNTIYFTENVPKTNNERRTGTIGHEILHGVLKNQKLTEEQVNQIKQFNKDLLNEVAKGDISEEAKELLKDSEVTQILKLLENEEKYEEVITYGFENAKFAKFLLSIESKDVTLKGKLKYKHRTFWGRLRKIISDIVDTIFTGTSKLDELNYILNDIFRKTDGIKKTSRGEEKEARRNQIYQRTNESSRQETEYILRQLEETEQELANYIENKDFDIESKILQSIPIINKDSAIKETGVKVGISKDIHLSKASPSSDITVDAAAHSIWESLTEEEQNNYDTQAIRNIILDYLTSSETKTSREKELKDKIKSLEEQLDNIDNVEPEIDFQNIIINDTKSYKNNLEDNAAHIENIGSAMLFKYVDSYSKQNKKVSIDLIKNRIINKIQTDLDTKEFTIEQRELNTKLIENLKQSQSNIWDNILDTTKRKYGIDINTEYLPFDEEVDLIQKTWEGDTSVTPGKSTVSTFTKGYINSIQKRVNYTDINKENIANGILPVKYENTPTGYAETLDFDLIIGKVFEKLQGIQTTNQLLDKIFEISKTEPAFTQVYNDINKDENLRNILFRDLVRNVANRTSISIKTKNDSIETITAYHENEKSYYHIRLADTYKREIEDRLKSGYYDNGINGQLVNEIKVLKEIDLTKDLEDISKQLSKVYSLLGIDIEFDKLQRYLFNNKENLKEEIEDFIENIQAIKKEIKKSSEKAQELLNQIDKITNELDVLVKSSEAEITLQPKRLTKSKELRKAKIATKDIKFDGYGYVRDGLAKKLDTVDLELNEQTITNVAGNQIYLTGYHSYLTSWFANKENKEDFRNLLLQYRLVPKMKDSFFLNQLLNEDGTLNEKNVEAFTLDDYGGNKDINTQLGKEYKDFNATDFLLAGLLLHIDSRSSHKDVVSHFITIPSDASNTKIISFKKVNFGLEDMELFNAVLSNLDNPQYNKAKLLEAIYNTEWYQNVWNTVLQEVKESQTAFDLIFDTIGSDIVEKNHGLNLIENYHHKGSKVLDSEGNPIGNAFKFMNFTLNGKTLNELIERDKKELSKGYYLLDDIVNGDSYTELGSYLREKTLLFIGEMITKNVGVYNEYKNLYSKKTNMNSFETSIAEFAINDYLFNVESRNLFGSSLKSVKNIIEVTKRGKEQVSNGSGFAISNINEGYHSVTIEDVYKNVEGLGEVNTTDGISKITKPTRLKRNARRGNFKITNFAEALEEGNFEVDTKEDLVQEKPFYYGFDYDTTLGTFVEKQVKNSIVTLDKETYQGLDLGTLAEVVEELENELNTEIQLDFKSAVKKGARKVIRIHDNEGNLLPRDVIKDLIKNNTEFNYYKNLRIVQDTNVKIQNTVNKLGTQVTKVILTNLKEGVKYNVNGKPLDKEQITNEVFDIFNTNVFESENQLLESLIEGNVITEADIIKKLNDEAKARLWDDNLTEALEIKDGQPLVPLYYNLVQKRYISFLTSLWTNNVTNQKMNGYHAFQVPNVFMSGATTHKTFSGLGNADINWLDSKEDKKLNFIQGKNLVAEVLVSRWDKRFKDINVLDSKVLQSLGYRIPTEGKYSAIVFKVVGFLPDNFEGSIVIPDGWTATSGSDFDIDSIYVMSYNLGYQDKKLIAIPYLDDENSTEEERYYNYVKSNSAKKAISTESIDNLDKDLESLQVSINTINESLQGDINEKQKKMYLGFLDTLLDEYEKIDLEKEKTTKEVFKVTDEFRALSISEQNTRSARDNRLIDLFISILDNPNTMEEILETSNFKDVQAPLEKLDNLNSYHPNLWLDKVELTRMVMGNKDLKGISVNLKTLTDISNVARIYNPISPIQRKLSNEEVKRIGEEKLIKFYGEDYNKKTKVITYKYLGNNSNGTNNNILGDSITAFTSQVIANVLDAVANPMSSNTNPFTITQLMMFPMFGDFDYYYATYLIEQPIIKEWAKLDSNKDSIWLSNGKNPYYELKNKYERKIKDVEGEQSGQDIINAPRQLFTSEELLSNITPKNTTQYYKEQLDVLNYFQELKQVEKDLDILRIIASPDKVGAGPTFNTTRNITETINDSEIGYMIGDKKVIDALYPKEGKAVYPIIQAKYKASNQSSYEHLAGFFIEEVSDEIKTILGNFKFKGEKTTNKVMKEINKFLTISSEYYMQIDKNRLLGLNDVTDFNTELDITKAKNIVLFDKLSTANKLYLVQKQLKPIATLSRSKDLLANIKIDPNFNKNYKAIQYLDLRDKDIFKSDFEKLLTDDNNYIKSLAEDLVKYALVVDGLNYGNNLMTVVPIKYQASLGLGDHIRQKFDDAKDKKPILPSEIEFLKVFYSKNWKDTNLVPVVRQVPDDSSYPQWFEKESGVIFVNEKQFNKMTTKEKNAQVIRINRNGIDKLYFKEELEKGYRYIGINKLEQWEFGTTSDIEENNTANISNLPPIHFEDIQLQDIEINEKFDKQTKELTENLLKDIQVAIYQIDNFTAKKFIKDIEDKPVNEYTDYELNQTFKKLIPIDAEIYDKLGLKFAKFEDRNRDEKEKIVTSLVNTYNTTWRNTPEAVEANFRVPHKLIEDYKQEELLELLTRQFYFYADRIDYCKETIMSKYKTLDDNIANDLDKTYQFNKDMQYVSIILDTYTEFDKFKIQQSDEEISTLSPTQVKINKVVLQSRIFKEDVNNLRLELIDNLTKYYSKTVRDNTTNPDLVNKTEEEMYNYIKQNITQMRDSTGTQMMFDSAAVTTNFLAGNIIKQANLVLNTAQQEKYEAKKLFNGYIKALTKAGYNVKQTLEVDKDGKLTGKFLYGYTFNKAPKEVKEFINNTQLLMKKYLEDANNKDTIIHQGFIPAVAKLERTNADKFKDFIAYFPEIDNHSRVIFDKKGNKIKNPPLRHASYVKQKVVFPKFEIPIGESLENFQIRILNEIYYMYDMSFGSLKEVEEYNEHAKTFNRQLGNGTHAENISYDLEKVIPLFLDSVIEYSYKARLQDGFSLFTSYLKDEAKFLDTKPIVNKVALDITKKRELKTIEGTESNELKRVQYWYENNILGEDNRSGATATKWARVVQNYTAIKNLGLNPFAGVNNLAYGALTNLIYTMSNGDFSKKDRNNALAAYWKNMMSYILDTDEFSNIASSKESAIIKYFDIVNNQTEQVERHKEITEGKNLYSNIKSRGGVFFMQAAGEHMIQNVLLLSFVKGNRVKDGKIVNKKQFIEAKYKVLTGKETNQEAKDIAEYNSKILKETKEEFNKLPSVEDYLEFKDGYINIKEGVDEKSLAEFKEKVKRKAHELHGVYNKEDKSVAQAVWIWRAALQHRKWLRPGWNKRFGSRFFKDSGYIEATQARDKGTYTSLWQFVWQGMYKNLNDEERQAGLVKLSYKKMGLDMLNHIANFRTHYRGLDYEERQRVKNGGIELMTLAVVSLMLAAALKLRDDDDEETSKGLGFTINILDRLKGEFGFYTPSGLVNASRKILRSPAASEGAITDMFSFSYAVLLAGTGQESAYFKSGIHHDELKAKVYGVKLVPYVNQVYKWYYIDKNNRILRLY